MADEQTPAHEGAEPEPSEREPSEREPSERAADAGVNPKASSVASLGLVAFVLLVTTGAMYAAYMPSRAGQRSVLYIAGGCYALLAAVTLLFLHRRKELKAQFRPFNLDITIAAMVAGMLYVLSFLGAAILMPVGHPRSAWLMRVYLHLGDPRENSPLILGLAILLVAGLEEIVWRGLVMRALFDFMSKGRAVMLTAVLYGAVHATTLFQLGDPVAGLNPMLVAAAAGCGLVWGAIAWRFDRLLPAILAHALYSWAMVEFPLWHL